MTNITPHPRYLGIQPHILDIVLALPHVIYGCFQHKAYERADLLVAVLAYQVETTIPNFFMGAVQTVHTGRFSDLSDLLS